MATKATWLFNGAGTLTWDKVWGFSETWYTSLTGDALIAAMDTISSKRRLLLASDAAIVGYRIGVDNGRSFVIRKLFSAPTSNSTSNVPVDSALCQVGTAGGPAIKRFWLHDLPDDWILGGKVIPSVRPGIFDLINTFSALGFQVRFQNQAAVKSDVLSITTLGLVTTVQAFGTVAGDLVSFLNCKDINGKPIRGQYIVETVTDPTHFTVAHWSGVTVGRSGKVRKVAYLFGTALALGDRGLISAGSRKVGRPFFQSRGRAPIRR
jgi:hypothetical protein